MKFKREGLFIKKMVKVLAIGDVHFQVSNIPEVDLFIERITRLAKEEEPDLILILGDVLHDHEKLHSTPMNKAKELFVTMKEIAQTYVLVGNHDALSNQIFLDDGHWMNILKEWEGLEVVDRVQTCECEGELFVMVPYVPPGRFVEALNTIGDAWKGATCIFAHQEFYGCKMGAITSLDGDKWPLKYPRVVSGHIHSKDNLQKNIYYTGSALQVAFGESKQNTVAVLEFDMGKYECREVDLKLPRKKGISTSLKKVMDFEIPDTEDKIMLSISGANLEEFKAFQKSKKYKELQKAGIKIKFTQKNIEELKQISKEAITQGSDFNKILHDLIHRERNPNLTSVYELIIHGKRVPSDDIFYI